MTKPETSDAPTDCFPWPGIKETSADSADRIPIGELPSSGPIRRFINDGEVLSRPDVGDAARPWVIASTTRAVKVYDLDAFTASDMHRHRLLDEALKARRVNDIPGVVHTHRTGVIDDRWFVLEMDRLGSSLASWATDPASRPDSIDAGTYLRYVTQVAETLDLVHGRGVLHCDVRPGNLMLDTGDTRLVVADFSISDYRRRRFAFRGPDPTESSGDGGDPFHAPEQALGQMSPRADQFALAATTQFVLKRCFPAASENKPVSDVLARATAHDPQLRYPTMTDFGTALRQATNSPTSFRLSVRLSRVDPRWRHAWSPAAAAWAATFLLLVTGRSADRSIGLSIVLPTLAAALTAAIFRVVNRWRARRTRPRWSPADRGWFPVVVFAVVMVAASPILASEPSSRGEYVAYATVAALVATAVLGSVPKTAGLRLIRYVRWWEQTASSIHGKLVRAVGTTAIVVGLLLTPALVSEVWPRTPDPADVTVTRVTLAVAETRQALLDGNVTSVCRLVHTPPRPRVATCAQWAPVAIRWLRQDMQAGRGAPFTTASLRNMQVMRQSDPAHALIASWGVRTNPNVDRFVAYADQDTEAGDVWTVTVSRLSGGDDMSSLDSDWTYEVVIRHANASVTSLRVCDYKAVDSCVTVNQLTPHQLRLASHRGPPVGR